MSNRKSGMIIAILFILVAIGFVVVGRPFKVAATSSDQAQLTQLCVAWKGNVDYVVVDSTDTWAIVGCSGPHKGGQIIANRQGSTWVKISAGGGQASADDLTAVGVPSATATYLVNAVDAMSPTPTPTPVPTPTPTPTQTPAPTPRPSVTIKPCQNPPCPQTQGD
jgi:hypothetical protein